ncbi:peptide deformylase [Alphaproteobacteria bacterium]|nr:peptide deformylase [Alphaproteobacteria bacterium]
MKDNQKVAQIGDPILRKKTLEVKISSIPSKKIKKIINRLILTMRKLNGAGLAANQIFYNLRICIIELQNNIRYKHLPKIPLTILINPKIRVLDKNATFNSYEGCLSVPNLRGVVKRFTKIQVDYYDENKCFHSKKVVGFPAIVYQHEIDHLDGILFIDKVKNYRTLVTNENYIKFYEKKYLKSVKKLSN